MINEQGVLKSIASSNFDDKTRYGGVNEEESSAEDEAEHKLDSKANQKKLARFLTWYDQEMQRQAANRYQMSLDCDYYDSMQWEEADAQAVMDRGQAPVVYNEIKPTIDWMIGTERRARIDYKILPRHDEPEARDSAENKTSLLKYLSDVNKTPFQRSLSFESCVKAGVGWIETGIRGDATDELLFTRSEDWRNCLHDSNSTEADMSDGRYFFRHRWLDDDIAIAYFPERKAIIEQSVINSDAMSMESDDEAAYYMGARVTNPSQDYQGSTGKYRAYNGSAYASSTRARVKFTECWYKNPKLVRKISGGDYQGELYDEANEEHKEALQGGCSLYDKLEMEIRVAIYCTGGLLYDEESPYEHNKIPFVPVWCYRRTRDNLPYGAIRTLRDAQDSLNKRASKALWILSSNRVVMDEGAVEDVDELRREVARPDSVVVKRAGKTLEISRDVQLAQEHLELMDRDVSHIRNVGGVNNENLGRSSNASSGVAIDKRAESGSVTTTAPFDNLRFATQLVGEMELSNVEQFYTAEKSVRILGARGGAKFIKINQQDEMGNVVNDITKSAADYVVDEQAYRSTIQAAMFESLFDIVGKLASFNPEVALNLLDLVVDMNPDLVNKDELVSRIRKLNGQRDPDAEATPEELAQQQKQAELMRVQEQTALATMENQLAKLVAETGKLDAQAMSERIKAMYAALQAAGVVATVPAASQIADEILKGAGFKDKSIEENTAMIELAAQEMQQQPQQLENPQEQQGDQYAENPQEQQLDVQQQQVPPPNSAMQGINYGIRTQEID